MRVHPRTDFTERMIALLATENAPPAFADGLHIDQKCKGMIRIVNRRSGCLHSGQPMRIKAAEEDKGDRHQEIGGNVLPDMPTEQHIKNRGKDNCKAVAAHLQDILHRKPIEEGSQQPSSNGGRDTAEENSERAGSGCHCLIGAHENVNGNGKRIEEAFILERQFLVCPEVNDSADYEYEDISNAVSAQGIGIHTQQKYISHEATAKPVEIGAEHTQEVISPGMHLFSALHSADTHTHQVQYLRHVHVRFLPCFDMHKLTYRRV